MNRSLYTKLVLIILFLIIALMLVAGVFLTRGVRNFYLSDFYDNMAEVFSTQELADTLRDYGAEEMFLRSRGSLRVRMDLADSDYQAFMGGDEDAICQFQGEFMQQYSWAEPMVCTLQEKKELMLARMGKHRM